MKIILASILLLSAGCATKPFVGNTQKEEVIKTGKSKSTGYDDSLVFFAKYMNDSNSAIKVKERESGQLVVKLSHPCEVTLPLGNKGSLRLSYIADVRFKNDKAKFKLDVDPSYDYGGSGYVAAGRARLPASKDQQGNLNKCLSDLHKEITEGIKAKKEAW